MVSSAAASEVQCLGGDRFLSVVYLLMGRLPGAVLSDWQRARATIIGFDLLNLVTYITAWTDATLDEMAVFIYNEGGISTNARRSLNVLVSLTDLSVRGGKR